MYLPWEKCQKARSAGWRKENSLMGTTQTYMCLAGNSMFEISPDDLFDSGSSYRLYRESVAEKMNECCQLCQWNKNDRKER